MDVAPKRLDAPEKVAEHQGRYSGKVALCVLGGASGAGWKKLRDELIPDVFLGANGANLIRCLDYWLLSENLTRTARMAEQGDPEAKRVMFMFNAWTEAPVKMISYKSMHLVKDPTGYIPIRTAIMTPDFSWREYGNGLLVGPVMQRSGVGAPLHVGTVGLHMLHLAAILGAREIHTIGFDLCFKDGAAHHWYNYPDYHPDRYRTPEAFVEYKGLKTQWAWIEAARYIKTLESGLEAAGITWHDHSDGLLKAAGLRCAR